MDKKQSWGWKASVDNCTNYWSTVCHDSLVILLVVDGFGDCFGDLFWWLMDWLLVFVFHVDDGLQHLLFLGIFRTFQELSFRFWCLICPSKLNAGLEFLASRNSIDFKATYICGQPMNYSLAYLGMVYACLCHKHGEVMTTGDCWCDVKMTPVAHQSQSEQPSAAAPAPPRMSSVLLVFNQNFQAGRTGDLRLMGLRVMLYDVVIFSRLHQLHRLHREYFAWHGQCGWYMVEMFAGHSQGVE